ncbi:MAG TPA: DNA repair protein RecO [Stellaceae bacterium]|nr:DNA repair protein RecO [Stellaceae bacterium]
MDWTDDAIVLGARRHGEGSLVVALLTRQHGAHKGLVRGGAKSRERGIYEPGNRVVAHWQARLAEHLGLLRLEPVGYTAAKVMDNPLRLACLEAATALVEAALPERASHPAVYGSLVRVLAEIEVGETYPAEYLRFERELLAELGFGLDLSACAVTGTTSNLAYVSPKTGRAVSLAGAGQYKDRLLVLPRVLGGSGSGGDGVQDLLDGFDLTGSFLERHALGAALPPARGRFVDRLRRLHSLSALGGGEGQGEVGEPPVPVGSPEAPTDMPARSHASPHLTPTLSAPRGGEGEDTATD